MALKARPISDLVLCAILGNRFQYPDTWHIQIGRFGLRVIAQHGPGIAGSWRLGAANPREAWT